MGVGTLIVGTVGLKLKIKLKTGPRPVDPVVDLSSYTSAFFDVQKPNATPGEEGLTQEVEWTAVIESPSTDGYISYVLQANDLDVSGPYIIQPRIEKAGVVLKGAAYRIQVHPNFEL